jgi:hypothetical protein
MIMPSFSALLSDPPREMLCYLGPFLRAIGFH